MYIPSAFWGCCRGIGGKQTKRKYRKYQKFPPSDRYRGDRGHRIRVFEIIYEALSHDQSLIPSSKSTLFKMDDAKKNLA